MSIITHTHTRAHTCRVHTINVYILRKVIYNKKKIAEIARKKTLFQEISVKIQKNVNLTAAAAVKSVVVVDVVVFDILIVLPLSLSLSVFLLSLCCLITAILTFT